MTLLAIFVFTGPALGRSCHIHRVAEVPLYNTELFLNVPVTVDGQRVAFLLDTGSEGSLITPEGEARLQLPADDQHVTFMRGASGRGALSRNLRVSSLRVGGLDLGARSVPMGALPGLPAVTVPPVVGLMGVDMWRGLDLELNVKGGHAVFWSQGVACSGDVPPWPAGSFRSIPAREIGGRLAIAVRLNGVEGVALLDSGARSTIVSGRFARKVGVSAAMLAADKGGVASGVDLNARRYVWHQFRKLEIGGDDADGVALASANPVLTVSDIHDEADMLLGAEWLTTHDVWLAYRQGRIFVRPAR